MTPLRLAPLALVAALAFLSACSGSRPTASAAGASHADGPVVATYAGQQLTLSEFERHYVGTMGSREEAAQEDPSAYADFLRRYVDFRLKVEEARRLGLDEDSTLMAEVADYRQQLALPYFVEREVTRPVARVLFDRQQEEIRARHILFRVDQHAAPADTLAAFARASAVLDSIRNGLPFDEAAFRHSEDASAKSNRGDLGYFSGGRMIPEFEDAVYATSVGEVSGPHRSRFGYHLIRTEDRRPASPDLRLAHILVRPQAPTREDSAAARTLIEQLQARVAAGEDFATLARQYSEDRASAQNGGDLGFVSYARMVQPFADSAFGLPRDGDVTGIIETRFGYHIAKRLEAKAPETFEEAYERLKAETTRTARTGVLRQEAGRAYRERVGSALDTTVLRSATAQIPDSALVHTVQSRSFGEANGEVFATIGDSSFTLGDFAGALRSRRILPNQDRPFAVLLSEAEHFLNEAAIPLAASEFADEEPEFQRIMSDYRDGVLLFRISEDSVWAAAQADSVALQRHFEANRAKYAYPDRRRVITFTARADSVFAEVMAALDAGQGPEAAAAPHRDLPGFRVDTLYVADSTGSVYDVVLGLAPGQRTDVLTDRRDRVVAYYDALEPTRPKSFEEARAQVVTDYQDALEAAFVERLRAKYDARLYPERLSAAFAAERAASPAGTDVSAR